MSSAVLTCERVPEWSLNLRIQAEVLSRVSWNPSQMAMVALMAVTRPLERLSKTARLSQLLTLRPSMTIESS